MRELLEHKLSAATTLYMNAHAENESPLLLSV